jgi:tetratricopeptide (TPR) repeat protein
MIVAHLLLPALLAAGAIAPAAPETATYEDALLQELAANPAAQAEARAASDAYVAERWPEAIERYERVLALAPTFSHALRRQCSARLDLGERDTAVALCRKALALRPLPETEGALARAPMPAGPAPSASLPRPRTTSRPS